MTTSGTRVTFMGSPEFAVPTLRALTEAGYNLVQVVTQPDRRAGRGGKVRHNPVKVAALELDLPIYQPNSIREAEAVDELRRVRPDVIVVAAYGKILPKQVLGLPTRGILNIHASLLPRWRGASPIVAAILNGDQETGVSIMEIEPKMDTGPVISQRTTAIGPNVTAGELEERLASVGAEELVTILPEWLAGSKKATPQDDAQATYCSLLSKGDGMLADSMTAEAAALAVRAFNPWPGAFVTYVGERLAVWRAHTEHEQSDDPPGTLGVTDREVSVTFREGRLVLDEVQRPGSRRVGAVAFLNGLRGELAATVGLR